MSRAKRKPLPVEPVLADIESLTHEGRGLTRVEGKAVFVDGALAGERVRFRYSRMQRHFDEGRVVEVLSASPQRVPPPCPHFSLCGGCSLQHQDPAAQIAMKQEILADVLRRIGGVEPERWLPPLAAGHWGYRRKARLGVRFVAKKGKTLVGFREKGSGFLADLSRCEVLHPDVGERIGAIAALVDGLSIRDQVPQIEMAKGEGPCVLVFRVLQPPAAADLEQLVAFAAAHGLRVYLQEGGPETIRPLPGQAVDLSYSLPDFDVRLHFLPTDFTQVNLELNRLMVRQALELLDPGPEERVLDLFCGLGNFTLPLARRAGSVLGVEAEAGLVERARGNAQANGLRNVRFEVGDLYGSLEGTPWTEDHFHKALLDPPRAGALQVLDMLPALGVQRLLYVSCFPATLARDAERLVKGLGYRLRAVGAMDMFPHTAHVESMALFERA
ncbi:MAG TPA: 23S rRNA (uracil(1939)-C(5))-methyltransferase RlmD [Chromatiaceae bacterium]|nr:23S rRNA (uracil(1939)-C(5))-methyltransferase RlmD [Chromatiaceae bacterium]